MLGAIGAAMAVVNPVVAASTLAGGAGQLIGAKLNSDAAKSAAQLQAEATQRALDLQEKQYNQTRSDQEPWRQAGLTALGGMQGADYMRDFTAADFEKDPGYEFRMSEGQKALERSAAARGGLQSGGTLKALSRYGQDYASNEFQRARDNFNADRDRRFGRLTTLAGYGTGANSTNAAAGANYADNSSGLMTDNANAQGAAKIASANAWGGAISNISKNWMDMSMMGMSKNPMGGK